MDRDVRHGKQERFELYTKFEFLEKSQASKFDNDHEKIISQSASASKIMSDYVFKMSKTVSGHALRNFLCEHPVRYTWKRAPQRTAHRIPSHTNLAPLDSLTQNGKIEKMFATKI